MDPCSLQRLLSSTQRISFPIVKLDNIIQLNELNNLKQTSFHCSKPSEKGTCFFCGKEGEVRYVNLSSEVLTLCSKSSGFKKVLKACSCCELFVLRMNELGKSYEHGTEEQDAISKGLKTVFQLKLANNGSSNALQQESDALISSVNEVHQDGIETFRGPQINFVKCEISTKPDVSSATEEGETSLVLDDVEVEYGIKIVHEEKESQTVAVTVCPMKTMNEKQLRTNTENLKSNRIRQCYFCQKSIRGFGELRKHVRIHTNEFSLKKCQHCGKEFRYVGAFNYHLLHTHGTKEEIHAKKQYKEKLKCYFCHERCRFMTSLESHLTTHTKEIMYHICPNCGKVFKKIQNLRTHVISIHGPRKEAWRKRKELARSCYFCGKRYKKFCMMDHHMRSKHTKEFLYSCVNCGKSYVHRNNLKQHEILHCTTNLEAKEKLLMRLHKIQESYKVDVKCYFCKKHITTKRELNEHLSQHTMEGESYKCDKCGKVFFRKQNYQTHKLLVCYLNIDPGKTEELLRQRRVRVQRGKDKQKGKCQNCGKIFLHLKGHVKRCCVDKATRKTCQECNITFGSCREKTVHDRKEHKLGKILQCYFCSMEFGINSRLEEHMYNHTQELKQ